MKNTTVTIGIPAFNEEANIQALLNDIFDQQTHDFIIEKIIINSDGSMDKTVEICKSIKDERIVVFDNKERKGLASGQDKIMKNTDSDILVLLNADTRIKDSFFIEKLITPIILENADMTAPSVAEATPTSFFEKILFVSTKIKNAAFETFNEGNNVYTCRGVARAFSKKLYTTINFSTSIGEDAFSYFYCISNKFRYQFVNNTKIIFKLPGNLNDHSKQSLRFFQSQELLKKEFGEKFVTKSYQLPKSILIKSVTQNFIKNPLLTSLYIVTLFYLKLKSLFIINPKDKWDTVGSSKKITI